MLKPSDLVGREFQVAIRTDLGKLERRVVAFDAEDAQSQMVEYCRAEGLSALQVSVLC